MPKDFEKEIKSIAEKKGGKIQISTEPAKISDGFILVYGEIEENCTYDAIFASNRDILRDIAYRELFANYKSE